MKLLLPQFTFIKISIYYIKKERRTYHLSFMVSLCNLVNKIILIELCLEYFREYVSRNNSRRNRNKYRQKNFHSLAHDSTSP